MSQCDYWWMQERVERCEMMGSICHCKGEDYSCALKGMSIATALIEQEQMDFREAERRAQKRKHPKSMD